MSLSQDQGAMTLPPETSRVASLRARVLTSIVRVVVKHWARGNPEAVVRRARRVFGYPSLLSFLYSRGVRVEKLSSPQVRGEWIIPTSAAATDGVLLYLHGGGYVSCSSQTHRPLTTTLARMAKCRVFSLDYRLAPEHPFPAAVDDAAAAFKWMVNSGIEPRRIAIAGDSAGGGLAITTMLRLREERHALPGAAVCLSPWADLTGAGSYANAGSCSMFQAADVTTFAGLYLCGAPPQSPEASPLFADLHGLPPMLVQASSSELLLDDAQRLHHRAIVCGVSSTLSIFPGVPHVWQIFAGMLPEARMAVLEIAQFLQQNGVTSAHLKPIAAETSGDVPAPRQA